MSRHEALPALVLVSVEIFAIVLVGGFLLVEIVLYLCHLIESRHDKS